MLTLKTKPMELRGIQTQVSKKTNNAYYLIYCEDVDNYEPHKFICKDLEALPEGLKKGDLVEVSVGYNNYKDLVVLKVVKVG